MEAPAAVSTGAVAVVVAVLALTGPVLGVVDLGASGGSELGHGTATVDDATLDRRPVVTDGRFGTGVAYLRVPDVTVELSTVAGRARLVYAVSVPALDFDRVRNRPIDPGSAGTVTLGMADRAFEYETIDDSRYVATVTVRVQSFDVDRTIYRENVTVEVRTDG